MQEGYFDTPEVDGFTLRTLYTEDKGIVTVTDLQARNRLWAGSRWYPEGDITINGASVLNMDNATPGTHAFDVGGAGESWYSIKTLNGQSLPVSSGRIAAGKTEIAISVTLYKDSSTSQPKLSGAVTIPLSNGFVRVMKGGAVQNRSVYDGKGRRRRPYIMTSSGPKPIS